MAFWARGICSQLKLFLHRGRHVVRLVECRGGGGDDAGGHHAKGTLELPAQYGQTWVGKLLPYMLGKINVGLLLNEKLTGQLAVIGNKTGAGIVGRRIGGSISKIARHSRR